MELKKQGIFKSEKTVGNYMHQMGIKARWWVRPYTVTTIDSDFLAILLKNILDEQFNPDEPGCSMGVSDITYIRTFEGFVVSNKHHGSSTRKIISLGTQRDTRRTHVVDCIEKAIKTRGITSPLIFHTDRGCQYVSEAVKSVTANMTNSYS